MALRRSQQRVQLLIVKGCISFLSCRGSSQWSAGFFGIITETDGFLQGRMQDLVYNTDSTWSKVQAVYKALDIMRVELIQPDGPRAGRMCLPIWNL